MIDNGADVNAKNNFGETSLDIVGYNEEIRTVLVEHGAMTSKPLIGIVHKNSTCYDNMPIGNYVMYVMPSSPAYFAGIEKGDIITEFCGVAVEDVNQLNAEKSKYAAGDEVELKVYKGVSGKIETVKIKLAQNV